MIARPAALSSRPALPEGREQPPAQSGTTAGTKKFPTIRSRPKRSPAQRPKFFSSADKQLATREDSRISPPNLPSSSGKSSCKHSSPDLQSPCESRHTLNGGPQTLPGKSLRKPRLSHLQDKRARNLPDARHHASIRNMSQSPCDICHTPNGGGLRNLALTRCLGKGILGLCLRKRCSSLTHIGQARTSQHPARILSLLHFCSAKGAREAPACSVSNDRSTRPRRDANSWIRTALSPQQVMDW